MSASGCRRHLTRVMVPPGALCRGTRNADAASSVRRLSEVRLVSLRDPFCGRRIFDLFVIVVGFQPADEVHPLAPRHQMQQFFHV
nr:MAG: hypothetical protein [Microvirus sp.]